MTCPGPSPTHETSRVDPTCRHSVGVLVGDRAELPEGEAREARKIIEKSCLTVGSGALDVDEVLCISNQI